MREAQSNKASASTSHAHQSTPPAVTTAPDEHDAYLAAANRAAAAVIRRYLDASAPAAPSGEQTVIHRRTSYLPLQPKMKGNNDLRVFEENGFHISIADPKPRTNMFDKFHVTVENNTDERNAHFFYDDTGKYLQAESERHGQSVRYRQDLEAAADMPLSGIDPNGRLRPWSTLENLSSYASRGFLQVLQSTKQTALGNTGIRIESGYKAPILPPDATIAQKLGARPRQWTAPEANEWLAQIQASIGADVGTFSAVAPIEGGLKAATFLVVNNAEEMGEAVLKDVVGLGAIVSAARWGKPPPPAPMPANLPPQGTPDGGGAKPATGPAPSKPAQQPAPVQQPARGQSGGGGGRRGGGGSGGKGKGRG